MSNDPARLGGTKVEDGPGGGEGAEGPWQDAVARDRLGALSAEAGPDAAAAARLWQRIDATIAAGGAGAGGSAAGGSAVARAADASRRGAEVWWAAGAFAVLSAGVALWLIAGSERAAPPTVHVSAAAAPTGAIDEPATIAAPAPLPPPAAAAPAEAAGPTVLEPAGRAVDPEPPVDRDPAAGEDPPELAPFRAEARRPEDLLQIEVALVGRARTLLERGDSARALKALRQHVRRFPEGQLTEERAALEIVAYSRLGSVGRVETLARTFLARFPRSVHAAAVREAQAAGR